MEIYSLIRANIRKGRVPAGPVCYEGGRETVNRGVVRKGRGSGRVSMLSGGQRGRRCKYRE